MRGHNSERCSYFPFTAHLHTSLGPIQACELSSLICITQAALPSPPVGFYQWGYQQERGGWGKRGKHRCTSACSADQQWPYIPRRSLLLRGPSPSTTGLLVAAVMLLPGRGWLLSPLQPIFDL